MSTIRFEPDKKPEIKNIVLNEGYIGVLVTEPSELVETPNSKNGYYKTNNKVVISSCGWIERGDIIYTMSSVNLETVKCSSGQRLGIIHGNNVLAINRKNKSVEN